LRWRGTAARLFLCAGPSHQLFNSTVAHADYYFYASTDTND